MQGKYNKYFNTLYGLKIQSKFQEIICIFFFKNVYKVIEFKCCCHSKFERGHTTRIFEKAGLGTKSEPSKQVKLIGS